MKARSCCFLPLLAAVALLPASVRAEKDDAASPPAKPERREMRVIRDFSDKNVPKEPVTFLGIETVPVSPTLVAQLGLTDGAGLVVAHVTPDSPAAAALKEHDILVKLDDQLLIETRQLAVLVRNHKEGDEVTLTFIRGGKQQTAKVKLAKREMPKLSLAAPFGGVRGGAIIGSFTAPSSERIQVELQQRQGELQQRAAELQQREAELASEQTRMMELLQSAPPRSSVRIIESEGGPATGRVTMLHPGKSQMMYSDEAGTLELKIDDDQKELTAKDAKGTVIFAGPINTAEERKALPEGVRPRLERILQMQGFSFTPDGNFQVGRPALPAVQNRPIALPAAPARAAPARAVPSSAVEVL